MSTNDGKKLEEKKVTPVKPTAQAKPASTAQKPAAQAQAKPAASAQKPAAQSANAPAKTTQEKANSNADASKAKAKKEDGYDEQADIQKNKMWALLACIPFLFFLPLVTEAKTSKFARFYANQGLILLILLVVVEITLQVTWAILWNAVYSSLWHIWWIFTLIELAIIAVIVVFGVLNAVAASQGKWKKLPLVGKITIIK